MSNFKLPPGSTLNLKLKRRRRKPQRKDVPRAAGAPKKGILPTDAETPRYIRRHKGNVTFYDLGARRTAPDAPYAHVEFLPLLENNVTLHSFVESYNQAMIPGDADSLDCLRLPLASEWLYVDSVLRPSEGDPKRFLLGQGNKRPFVKDFPENPEAPAPNETSRAWKGSLKLSGSFTSLALESGFYYHPFDISQVEDYGFKVTETSDPDAPALAGFTFEAGHKWRIYLTPRVRLDSWVTGYDSEEQEIRSARLGRMLPVLPAFAPNTQLNAARRLSSDSLEGTAAAPLQEAIYEYRLTYLPSDVADDTPAQNAPPDVGMLIAILHDTSASRRYYVWSPNNATDPLIWSFVTVL
ncbi:MAG: hypothetical protein WCF57_20365 [Pyrinomonadaceae bacterium]